MNNSSNAFLSVIAQNVAGRSAQLACATYLGGTITDSGRALSVASPGQVYVAGMTNSPDFPWRDNVQPFNGAADAFLAKFDPAASGAAWFLYATPLGGTSPLGGAACGGGGGGSDAVSAGTPAGTYTLTVTATGPSGAAHSIPLSLTVW